jgi:glycosyltransferase involved in cell wall biosynthesis
MFVQATDPAGYPPLINCAMLMAEAGWNVTFLSAPIADTRLMLPTHPRIRVKAIRARASHVMAKGAYAAYCASAAQLALASRPRVVYASDPLGAAPGLLAARLGRSLFVYHEHDSPMPRALRPWLARMRCRAARVSDLVIFPNEERARTVEADLGIGHERTRVIWNMPRRGEIPQGAAVSDEPLIVYYHGSITPDRLPESVIAAILRFNGRVRLRIAGYQAPGAPGYVSRLVQAGVASPDKNPIEYVGEISREHLLTEATKAHVGLALMPAQTDDLNMRHMAGASNKAFDYMASTLALLVSDLPDWRHMFVAPGYAQACDPRDPNSIAGALQWFLDHPSERRAMALRGRAKIETEWNYDTAFSPIMDMLQRD